MDDVSYADTSVVSHCGAVMKSGTLCLSQSAHCDDMSHGQKKREETRGPPGLGKIWILMLKEN